MLVRERGGSLPRVSLTPVAYVRPRGALKATNRFKLFTYANTSIRQHTLPRKTHAHRSPGPQEFGH